MIARLTASELAAVLPDLELVVYDVELGGEPGGETVVRTWGSIEVDALPRTPTEVAFCELLARHLEER